MVAAAFDVRRIAAAVLLLTAFGIYAVKLKRRDACIFDERHRLKPGWAAGGLILVLIVAGDLISLVDR